MKFGGVAAVAAGVMALAGCGSGEEPSATQETSATSKSEVKQEALGEVGTVEELMEAAVAAGYSCPNWQQDNVVVRAAESGRCSDADVFSTYLSADAAQKMAEGMKETGLGMQETVEEMGGDPLPTTTLLVGPNWIINSPDAAELQPELDGAVMTW